MKTQRIPLVGSLTQRSLSITIAQDQQFINCFPEITKNQITGEGVLYLLKRPGTAGTNCAGASYVGAPGSVVWGGFSTGPKGAFCYLNGTTLQVWDSNRVQIGGNPVAHTTGFTSWTRLSETVLSGTANLVLLAKESATDVPYGWYYPEGGAWTEIVDADFPANAGLTIAGNAVHMDGFMFVMDSRGQIWNSDLNSLSAWTATSFTSAQVYPDGGLGLARIKNTILGFGTQSVEFFQNAGNATGSPLTRISSATIRIGALPNAYGNGETIKTVGDSVYFIGINADSGKIGFYKIDGFTATKISNPAIDRYLQFTQLNGVTAAITGSMVMHGMTHIVLGTSTNATVATPCYCVDTGVWWYLTISGNGAESQSRLTACLGLSGEGYLVTSSNANNQGRKLFVTTQSTLGYVDDDGTRYTLTVQTMPLDQGTARKKFYQAAELIADYRSASENISISWSDDDYQTFSTARTISLSTGQRRVTRLGSTQRKYNNRRAWKITDTSLNAFRGQAIDIWYEVGTT